MNLPSVSCLGYDALLRQQKTLGVGFRCIHGNALGPLCVWLSLHRLWERAERCSLTLKVCWWLDLICSTSLGALQRDVGSCLNLTCRLSKAVLGFWLWIWCGKWWPCSFVVSSMYSESLSNWPMFPQLPSDPRLWKLLSASSHWR